MSNYLAHCRKKLGLSQSQVASFLGYATQLVSQWENGKGYPSLPIWSTYARLLEVDLTSFLEEAETKRNLLCDEMEFDQKRFSLNLKTVRANHGLTQKQVAEALHINNKTISSWEHSISTPSKEAFLALCRFYGVSMEELYFAFEEEKPAPEPETKKPWTMKTLLPSLGTLLLVALVFGASSLEKGRKANYNLGDSDYADQSNTETPAVSSTAPSVNSTGDNVGKTVVNIALEKHGEYSDRYCITYSDGSTSIFYIDIFSGEISSKDLPFALGVENGFFTIDGEKTGFAFETMLVDAFCPTNYLFLNNNMNVLTFGIVFPRKSVVEDFFEVDYKGGGEFHIHSTHDVILDQSGVLSIDGYRMDRRLDFTLFYPEVVDASLVKLIDFLYSEGPVDYYYILLESGFQIPFIYDTYTEQATISNPLFEGKISLLALQGQWNLNGSSTGFTVHSSEVPYINKLFKIAWLDYDGTLIEESEWPAGSFPSYGNAESLKFYDEGYCYDFSYWSPSIDAVTEDRAYTANYAGNCRNAGYALSYFEEYGNVIVDFNASSLNEPVLYLPVSVEGVKIDGIMSLPIDFPDSIKIHVPRTYSYVDPSLLNYLE